MSSINIIVPFIVTTLPFFVTLHLLHTCVGGSVKPVCHGVTHVWVGRLKLTEQERKERNNLLTMDWIWGQPSVRSWE